MNKATIITDAITYIEELKTCVEELSNQLLQMEATTFGEEKIKVKESDVEQEMKKLGIRVIIKLLILFKLFFNQNFEFIFCLSLLAGRGRGRSRGSGKPFFGDKAMDKDGVREEERRAH